ncbi:MAG: DMT family transporter [Candidatus Roizmanbacteria bacterium]|nr:DMT family transporter [Candidatus Roizmanbacteria bacterium]
MKLSVQRQGELYLIAGILLWSIFPIFTQLSYSAVSPYSSLAVSSLFSALFFAVILTIRHRWREVLNIKALRYTLYSTFFVGIIYYLLYFLSLRYSSAGNVSILALSEAFFSFLLFHVWKKEYIPKEHIYGAAFILLGAVIVLVPSITLFHIGDLLILLGAAIVPFGNLFVQKARKLVNTETIMFVRGFVGSCSIFILSFLFHAASPLPQVLHSLSYLITNGVFILGLSTMLWVEGIHRIPVTKANALSSLGPLITLLFAWVIFKTSPTSWQLISFIPMFIGVLLISKKISKT